MAGLCAKPAIDIALRLPCVCRIADVTGPLVRAGWTEPIVVGDHWATYPMNNDVRSAIGHVFTAERWAEAHVRLFADWLSTIRRTVTDMRT